MTTQEVAQKWHELCQQGQNVQCIEDLYADDIVSTEMPGMPEQIVSGKSKVLQKTSDWFSTIEEWHGGVIGEPNIAGIHFTSVMTFDATFKGRGRITMEEIGVFEVKNGKIINEQFFYSMN